MTLNITKVIDIRITWKQMFDFLLAISVSVVVSYIISEILDVEGWNDLQLSFKVIKSGTNRKLVYDFLLVVYSTFHRFWEIWCETVQWPWNMPKVIDSCITWKLSCGHVCKMFGRRWTNEAKIAISNDPTLIWHHLLQRTPANICINLILPETTFPGLHFCRWQ